MSEENIIKLKIELKRRGISIETLRMIEASEVAKVIKETWTMKDIASAIFYGKFGYFSFSDDEFIKEVQRNYEKIGENEWFYSSYLDDFENIARLFKN